MQTGLNCFYYIFYLANDVVSRLRTRSQVPLQTLKCDYLLESLLLTQMCVPKGARKSERSNMKRWTLGVNIVTPRRLGSNSFALYRRLSTNVATWLRAKQRGPRTEKTEPDLVSLAFRDRLVVLFFLRCFFVVVDRTSHGACVWENGYPADGPETREKRVWNIAGANTGGKFSVESISARSQCRSNSFPFLFFYRYT